MKLVKVKESIKENEFSIIPFGDLHIGSKECDYKKITDMVNWIKSKKNVRVILMGDIIDCGLRDSVGAGTFDNDMTPEQQINYVLQLLDPIKSKIIGSVSGNHTRRIKDKTSIDVDDLIAKQLGIPYDENSLFLKVLINEINYIIYVTHGSSGATQPSTKLSAVMKLSSYIDADIYCIGHYHDLITNAVEYFKVDNKDKMVKKDKRYFVVTGHYLKYGGYAENKNLAPGKTGSPKIILRSDKKDVHISI